MYTVLLGDENRQWVNAINEKINEDSSFCIVATAHTGKEAMRQTLQLKPDILILDVLLPEYDGVYVVNKIRNEMPNYNPYIYVLSGIRSSTVLQTLNRLNVDFYSMKPIEIDSFMAALRNIVYCKDSYAENINKSTIPRSVIEEAAKELVYKIGILPHLKANRCAVITIVNYLNNPNIYHKLSSVIYPLVASELDISTMAVERNLRRGIHYMLQNKTALYKEIFACYPSEYITNSEFLSITASYVKYKLNID